MPYILLISKQGRWRKARQKFHLSICPEIRVHFCPTFAGEIQTKALGSLAAGVPVVCTSKAVQGTFVTSNNGVPVADDPEEIAKHIINLLKYLELQQQFSKQGPANIEKYRRW